MKKTVGVILSALTILCAPASPVEAQEASPEMVAGIDEAMQRSIDSGWVAGGAVAVMRAGDVIFSKGYGFANLEAGTPATPQTVFRIGSVTKQFTAAAVLLLCEDGAISLDDPVSQHLPAFDQTDPTTVRQLLNHTAGLTDFLGRNGFSDREMWTPLNTDELVAYVLSARPLHQFPPGAGWSYSSSNYVIAGALVEKVSGQSLGTFLKTRMFEPLGMTSTALDDGRDVVAGRAMGYDRATAETPGYLNARTISMTVPFAAGALRSTVGDLLVCSDALAHGRALSADSFAEMITPARLGDGTRALVIAPDGVAHPVNYGLGVATPEEGKPRRIGHDGAIDGFAAMLAIYLDADVAVAVIVNTSPSDNLPFGGVVTAVETSLSGERSSTP